MKKHGGSKHAKGASQQAAKKPSTAAQRLAQERIIECSHGWNDLTEEQRTAWRHGARGTRSRTRKGRSHRLDGQKLYNKLNSVLAHCGLQRRTEPAPQPQFSENPVEGFQITGRGKNLAFLLGLSGPPVEDIMVFASPPWNAGRSYCGDLRFIGLLPAPRGGVSDITRLYLKKYGVPRENSRVFIRVWQIVDGWEHRAGMRLFNALVRRQLNGARPRRADRAGGQKG